MSSRALRKLQKQQEEERLAKLQETQPSDDDDEAPVPAARLKQNAFDFLNVPEQDAEDTASDNGDDQSEDEQPNTKAQTDSTAYAARPRAKPKRGKKKKKSGAKVKAPTPEPEVQKDGNLDDIDAALQELSTASDSKGQGAAATTSADPEIQKFYDLLAVDTKNLNSLNEMKKLFGSVVLEDREDDSGTQPGRRRRDRTQTVDLGTALTARYSIASRGQGLSGVALRRNVFVPGKEEWPKVSSGGLGMELVEKAWDGTTEYRFVHSPAYQEVQRQFEICVESMDPQRMIAHLQANPYHISTLLQVSEIAKQQGDNSVAADLLERSLFSFGRSVHSTFANALSTGRARFDFRRPENREFWLAAWRYIGSLGQRGTWKTAYEWAKLLLALDPEGDPYCVHLVLDYYALRGNQSEHFVRLASTAPETLDWGQTSPNVQISSALAHHRLKHGDEARKQLGAAIKTYPWIFARLFEQLEIERVPKAVKGNVPRNTRETLETEAYTHRAKDIWNNPNAVSFLVEVAESIDVPRTIAPSEDEISLSEARHFLLADVPALIGLLPRSITSQESSASDPLPPPDSVASYGTSDAVEEDISGDEDRARPEAAGAEQRELQGLRSWFSSILGRVGMQLRSSGDEANEETGEEVEAIEDLLDRLDEGDLGEEDIEQALARLRREAPEEFRDRINRIQQLHRQAASRAGQPGANPPGPSVLADQTEADAFLLYAGSAEGRAEQEAILRAIQGQRAVNEQPVPASGLRQATVEDVIEEERGAGAQPRPRPRPEPEPEPERYDDQRNQRWLAGQGMLGLKEFIAQHGADETKWGPGVDDGPATEYAQRTKMLQSRQSRNFILDYSLQQGAGSEARDLIRRLIG